MNSERLIITPEILLLITELDEFKGAWQFLGRLSPNRLQVLKKVATIESVGSSTRIEGAKLSDHEVKILLSHLEIGSFKSRDEQEVAGYALVCEEIFENFTKIPLTENMIKHLHSRLLRYSHKDERHRGEYKKFPNHVEAFDANGKHLGIIFETTSPFEAPFKMRELVSWMQDEIKAKILHPLLAIGIFNVTFLAIHPFQDGNGRLSRLLTSLLLLQSGYLYVPYSSLESVIEENKEGYYLALRRTQQTLQSDNPDWQPWLLFFLKSLQKQKNLLEQKITRERILNHSISTLSIQILSLLKGHDRLGITDLEKLTQANRNTLKKQLKHLVSSSQLLQHGKGKATWYTLS